MTSGVSVSDECKLTYEDVKKNKKFRYIIFYIKDEKIIEVEKTGARDAPYDEFLGDLQSSGPTDCRYGVFDYEYMHHCEGTLDTPKKKLFLMSWCPDTAKIKQKMVYSSSFDALKKALVGVQKYIQATDIAEASQESVDEKCRAYDRS